MNVSCNKCGKRYVIADDKIAGKTSVKIRCKQCQSLISVAVASPGSAAGPVPEASASASGVRPSPSGLRASPSGIRASPSGIRASPSGLRPSPEQLQWSPDQAAPVDLSATWYAMIHGKQTGPVGLRELMAKAQAGEVTVRTYLWKPGMGDWKRANDVPEVASIFSALPTGGQPSQPPRPKVPSKSVSAVQRDVAVANEVPTPEAYKPGNGHGNGNGHGHGTNGNGNGHQTALPPKPPPKTGVYGPVTRRSGVGVATPVAEPQPKVEPQPQPQEPAPQPVQAAAPATEPLPDAAPAGAQPLNDLFGDLGAEKSSLDASLAGEANTAQPLQDPNQEPKSDKFDPFASLAPATQAEAPPPGEATRFFIAQAGLNSRNPLWKIALAVAAFVLVPTAALFLLSRLHIVQLPTVTRTTEDGQEVQESFFSSGGITGLKDSLTGETKRRKAEAEKRRLEALAAASKVEKTHTPATRPPPDDPVVPKKPTDPNLANFYAENTTTSRVPKNRQDPGSTKEINKSGLSDEVAAKKLNENQKAFQLCIDNALRRNPSLAVGAITIILTIGPSGTVKAATVDPKKHEGTDWARCMMDAGKRIVFPSSDGETEVHAPFKLGVAL